MEISDPHFSEQYMRDGTVRIVTMGRRIIGKWIVKSGQLCIEAPKPRIPAAKRSGAPATSINSDSKETRSPTMSFFKSKNRADGRRNLRRVPHSTEVVMGRKLRLSVLGSSAW